MIIIYNDKNILRARMNLDVATIYVNATDLKEFLFADIKNLIE